MYILTKFNFFKWKFLNKNFFFYQKLNFLKYQNIEISHFNKFNRLSSHFNDSNQSFKIKLIEKTEITLENKNNFLFTKSLASSKIMNIFFFLNQPIRDMNTKKTAFFNFFYFKEKNKLIQSTNVKKVVLRWELVSDLFFNLFWYSVNPLVFSSPFFKKETLAVNWTFHNWEQILWRYYHLFFNFKLNQNTEKFNFFCLKMREYDINFFLITDSFYHFKNLYFFRDFNFYTIGLVSFNTNPWIVNFPIPVADNHFLMQLFFFKYIIFIKKNSSKQKYLFLKQISTFKE